MMIGKKFYKPLDDIAEDEYTRTAEWCNNNGAFIEDKGKYYEVVSSPTLSQEELNAIEIERLKAELSATDYKCLKYVDGALTESEYAETKVYRASLRARINELEK